MQCPDILLGVNDKPGSWYKKMKRHDILKLQHQVSQKDRQACSYNTYVISIKLKTYRGSREKKITMFGGIG
jgi:hypothetical protein